MSRYRMITLTFIKEQNLKEINAIDALLLFIIKYPDDIKIIKNYGVDCFKDNSFLSYCNSNFRKYYLPEFYRKAISNWEVSYEEAVSFVSSPNEIDIKIRDCFDKILLDIDQIAIEVIEKISNITDERKIQDIKLNYLDKKDGIISLIKEEYKFLQKDDRKIVNERIEKTIQAIKNYQNR